MEEECSCKDSVKQAYCDVCMEEIIAERLMTTEYLSALMQEPFIQEHVQVIPVGFDVTETERHLRTHHYEKGNGRAYNRVTYLP